MTQSEQDLLVEAIISCGITAGIVDGTIPMDGPQLLMVLAEIKDQLGPKVVHAVLGYGGLGVGSGIFHGNNYPSLSIHPLDEYKEIGHDLKNDPEEGLKKLWRNGGIQIDIVNLESLSVLERNVAAIRGLLKKKEMTEMGVQDA